MSFHRERIQGAGAIAAAARPPRSAPSKIVRGRRALGDSASAHPCRVTADTVRMPDGTVVKMDPKFSAAMPWCPTSSTPTGKPTLRSRIGQMTANTLELALPTSSVTPVTSPVVAPPTAPTSGGGRSTGLTPIGPKPPSPAPTSSSGSASSSSAPSTKVIVQTLTAPSATTATTAPSPYVLPPVDLSLLTSSPAPRKVPWLAIGLGAVALAILIRK